MSFRIEITKSAERDLVNAADYIEYTLKNPSAANHLLELAEREIGILSEFADIHPVIEEPALAALGIRFVVVNNYLAFYTIIGDIVYVIRFLFGKRDWISILKQGLLFE